MCLVLLCVVPGTGVVSLFSGSGAGGASAHWSTYWMSRWEYDEFGPDYFKQHTLGNRYIPSPSI